jgi:NAD(P)-dependent dehydrogenase (short-subunit alcohol dehydrogenase family)
MSVGSKIILITGVTDGIGLETARMLVSRGCRVLLHGRNPGKLQKVEKELSSLVEDGDVESFVADLSKMADVELFAKKVAEKYTHLDVLINNAGVFKTSSTIAESGLDVRFVVNTIAPYLLTDRLLQLMDGTGRIINLSSAAQNPVNLDILAGRVQAADDFTAYAQSKLALTMWSFNMAASREDNSPSIFAVNPGSLLNTKMVKEAFGSARSNVSVGAEILVRAALDDKFSNASGKYFDNDSGQFTSPHPDALDKAKTDNIVSTIQEIIGRLVK